MERKSATIDMAGETTASRLPLVLLPGTLCDARLFAPLLARLPPRSIVVGDMYGCDHAAALADRLLATAPAHFALLGFSLGAIVALEVAARAPERLAGLALIGGTARDVSPAHRIARRAAVSGIAVPQDHVAKTLWPSYVRDQEDASIHATILAMAAAAPAGALHVQTELALTRADGRLRLAAIAMPTLVLAGAEDAINPPPLQAEMANAIPGARLALVPDAGHFVLLERPDAAAAEIAAWLAAVDAFDTSPHNPVNRRLKECS